MKRLLVAAFVASLSCSAVHAAELPQYVKGPVSGHVFDCQEAKQKAPKPEAYVTQGDLDGDGKPDFIVEIAKGCQSNRDLYCNDEGCLIDIFLSSQELQMGSMKVKSFKIGKHGSKPALIVTKGGKACADQPAGVCSETLIFTGERFVKVQ